MKRFIVAIALLLGASSLHADNIWNSSQAVFNGGAVTSQITAADGTAAAPSFSFTNQPAMGMWRVGSNILGFATSGSATVGVNNQGYLLGPTQNLSWTGTSLATNAPDISLSRGGTNGALRIFGGTVPTISSGFGTSPSVVAGGSNSLFQVNVGTGGTATSGVVAFNGTWTTAPYCFAQDTTSQAITTVVSASTTQATLTASAAWTAGSLVNVWCASQ